MDQIIGSFDDVSGAIDAASILDLLDFTNLTMDQLDAAGLLDDLDNLGNLDSLSGITVRVVGSAPALATTASITAEIQPALLSGDMTGDTSASVYFGMIEEKTYAVTVASGTNNYGTGNKYFLDSVVSPTIDLVRGGYYTFSQSDSSNGGHPLRFSTTANGTHAGGTEYTSGVTATSNQVVFQVPSDAPDNLYYYCANHSGMGGSITVRNGGFRIRQMEATSVSAGTVTATADAKRPLDADISTSATISSPGIIKIADMEASISTSSAIADVTPNYIFFVDNLVLSGFDAPFATIQAICTAIYSTSGSASTSASVATFTPEKLGEEWTVQTEENETWRVV